MAGSEGSLTGIKRSGGVGRDQSMVPAAAITNVISFLLLIIIHQKYFSMDIGFWGFGEIGRAHV